MGEPLGRPVTAVVLTAGRFAVLGAILGLALLAPAAAGPPTGPRAGAAENGPAHTYFTDVVLVDQDGRSHRLYSDLLRGKVVVVNSFYTSCGTTCPMLMGTIARLQAALGEHVGRDVHLLSLTTDPAVDTPARLKEYAAQFGARPGWYLLTGDRASLALALRKFGEVSPVKEAHLSIVLVGNDRTHLWKKARGLAPAEELVRLVRGVLDDR